MWPKAFAQLIELAPHVSRLLPMADRFFQNKPTVDESSQRAIASMAEGLRGDLGEVTASHAGISREHGEQGKRLAEIAVEVNGTKAAVESVGPRIRELEQRLSRNTTLLVAGLLMNVVLIALVVDLLLHR